MKNIYILLFLFFIISCGEKNKQETTTKQKTVEIKEVKEKPTSSQPSEKNEVSHDLLIDELSLSKLTKIDSNFTSVPFYVTLNSGKLFIVSNCKRDVEYNFFDGNYKYGIANDSLDIILPITFDKIYTPNVTMLNCFEIKNDDQVGLFDYTINKVVSPQFDFILPSGSTASKVAYGYNSKGWFKIEQGEFDKSPELLVGFDPSEIIAQLKFDAEETIDNSLVKNYYTFEENDANEGNAVLVLPSFAEYLKLTDSNEYDDFIASSELMDFGTEHVGYNFHTMKKVAKNVFTFFTTVQEAGLDARGYANKAENLVTYNTQSGAFNKVKLDELTEYDYFCTQSDYRLINDSIAQSLQNQYEGELYNWETKYEFYKIDKEGNIISLKSNRYFDFTKFIFIDESYFEGCYGSYVKDYDYKNDKEGNVWVRDHLTIEDLDIMRNEIFAEYGYSFKSEKWKNHFSKYKWYQPQFDNVDDQLTEMDKHNIKIILEVKEKMKGKEEEFTNLRRVMYVAAG
ncbi:YARHG domain-containing protein [Flammeovirga yaeyamensis]|uniref:YARHG domain-containing protein n=1 Tax=Flammeovirga yaeyamensis TaxID=367791 RepID=A0AAX1N5H1_9BACT|nr:YARHG domain-containing protein [Flammeovirga yaeyamensis]MBB3697386.1 hypothetical protein [Flammeovirga yaeyamensis]NMF36080.1 YARHG domain-containing protein [Flammeovirga yaeyamensis]QWG02814.1 YARHG domain-containing protein [Flammeovirga yaeyamensis]